MFSSIVYHGSDEFKIEYKPLKRGQEKAQAIIEHENKIRLNKQSAQHLFELIENPPKANPKLAQAMKQYKQDLK
ncbi:MAG: DUF1778 domain-containing protein [Deltaproteobacteria bacterium]|uniref:type II toxin-antitoxin system TacA family antitoxin n=1 Tax=Desulfobacula sp. TaxID=2593537 RepID=UPI0019CBC25D|nr:DUF1778 domain-containing protein [Candidatus Desulfobacula maris]MBL6994401.1 DUF1778 domain-containing protein [Desulfobacula sp.]